MLAQVYHSMIYSSWGRMIFITMRVFHLTPIENRVKFSASGGIGVRSVDKSNKNLDRNKP